MICAPAAGVRLSGWEHGIGTAESTARTAQMITFSTKQSRSLCGRGGTHSLRVAKPWQRPARYSAPISRCFAKAFRAPRSDRALWNTAPRSLPERRPRKQCAMTASPRRESKVFELRSGEPRGAEATTKKFNVFAKWEEVCHLSVG